MNLMLGRPDTPPEYEYRIRKETKGDETLLIPEVRVKTKFFLSFTESWSRIVKIYDKYHLLDIPTECLLTHSECLEHIQGFQKQVEEEFFKNKVTIEVELISLEDVNHRQNNSLQYQ